MTEISTSEDNFSLSGRWKARAADEFSRLRVGDVHLDDSDWVQVDVPGSWHSTSALSHAEAVLYRREFELHEIQEGHRRWLAIDGLCYQGDVWLNGAYLGDTEGYFVEHTFEITNETRQGTQHLLAIEAICENPKDLSSKRNITGVLQDSEILDRSANPGGIWREVRIEETGPIKIDQFRLLVLEADNDRAILRVAGVLDSSVNANVKIQTTVRNGEATEHVQELVLARGKNEIEWHVAIENPSLWWPHSLGDQPLYDVTVSVLIDDSVSDSKLLRTGLRNFELRNWIASVNGERLFLKGTNFGPLKSDLAAISPDDYFRDLSLAKKSGLDLVRVHGHVAHPDLYKIADRLGLLIFQDFPLQRGYSRTIRSEAIKQSARLVQQLGHHPSIVLWNGHNEPLPNDGASEPLDNRKQGSKFGSSMLLRQQLPSWNRSILDRSVKRSFEKADPTRPVIAHSGVAPHLPQLDGTDSHLWFGWRHGQLSDLQTMASRIPRLVRFVSEFGAQSLPTNQNIAKICGSDNFPNIDTEALTRSGADLRLIERHTPIHESATWDDWVVASQERQSQVIRHTIEILRTLKYQPTGGYCQFVFADALPFVSSSVLDHERTPKKAWYALNDASRPVIIVADMHREEIEGPVAKCSLHVVSDLREEIPAATLTAEWRAPGMEPKRWSFEGKFEPDSVTKVTELQLEAPSSGHASLFLTLRGQKVDAVNHYQVKVC